MDEPVFFYSVLDEYGFLSNFAPYSIFLKDRIWPTTEHYFQAQKFVGTEHEELVRLCKTPTQAAKAGRDRARPLRPDWEAVKDGIMAEALRAKFTQHPELAEALLATGDRPLVERAKNDRYWGDGGDGSGKNMLGRLLMEVRTELLAAQ